MVSHPSDHDAFGELADLLLNVGRLVRARTPAEADGVPLNETERTVMRMVDLFPGASPSDIAERGRLQRSNVSAALRNLEELRAAWARELAVPLADDVDDVRQCAALLARLEVRLIDADRAGD